MAAPKQPIANRKLSKNDLEYLKIDSRTKVGLALISTLKWVGCSVLIYLSVKELAGRNTLADIRVLGNFSVSELVSYGTTAVAGVGWYRERRSRLKTIERLSPKYTALEKTLDPGRSSSGLGLDGLTSPEDA